MLRTLRSVLRFRRRARTRAERLRAEAVNIDDLRRLARRRLPNGVFNYIDGGAEDEVTMQANRAAFRRWNFAPRVLRDMSQVDTSTTLLGRRLPFPLVLAPAGFTRMPDPDGELAVARAAARAGIPYCLSTVATRSIEEVAAAADGCHWFQLYPLRDRELTRDLVQRAADAGYQAMMPTVDMAVSGRRERDVRRGFTLPPQIGLGTILDGIRHPGWTWRFIRSEPIVFSNVLGRSASDGTTPVALADFINTQFDPGFTWRDVAWLRDAWQGSLVIKGIQTVADARIAADHGCDAIVLSNHGGRQLDGAPPALDLVAPVADAVGRPHRPDLRRRRAPRRRHRQGAGPGRRRLHGRPRLSLRFGRRRRSRGRLRDKPAGRGDEPHHGAHRLYLGSRDRPRSRGPGEPACVTARRSWGE